MPARKSSSTRRVTQRRGRNVRTEGFLTARDSDTEIQRRIARTTNRTGSGRSSSFSGRGIEQTVHPLIVYNLERGLTKAQLINRVETMIGRKLSKSETRKLHTTRVKSLDEQHRRSSTDYTGRELRTLRTMEAWRISYS